MPLPKALSLARQLRNPIREALALSVLSSGYNLRGEWEQAINAGQASLAIYSKSKDFIGEASAASNLSTTYIALGETNKVIEIAEPALAFARKTKEHNLEVNLLVDLGNAYSTIGNYQKDKKYVISLALEEVELTSRKFLWHRLRNFLELATLKD